MPESPSLIQASDFNTVRQAIIDHWTGEIGTIHPVGQAALDALDRLNEEANVLTNRAESAERRCGALVDALRRIADEPPNRGLTPDFRTFARDALEVVGDV